MSGMGGSVVLAGYFGNPVKCPAGRVHLSPVYVSGTCITGIQISGYPADTPVEFCWCRQGSS